MKSYLAVYYKGRYKLAFQSSNSSLDAYANKLHVSVWKKNPYTYVPRVFTIMAKKVEMSQIPVGRRMDGQTFL